MRSRRRHAGGTIFHTTCFLYMGVSDSGNLLLLGHKATNRDAKGTNATT